MSSYNIIPFMSPGPSQFAESHEVTDRNCSSGALNGRILMSLAPDANLVQALERMVVVSDIFESVCHEAIAKITEDPIIDNPTVIQELALIGSGLDTEKTALEKQKVSLKTYDEIKAFTNKLASLTDKIRTFFGK